MAKQMIIPLLVARNSPSCWKRELALKFFNTDYNIWVTNKEARGKGRNPQKRNLYYLLNNYIFDIIPRFKIYLFIRDKEEFLNYLAWHDGFT